LIGGVGVVVSSIQSVGVFCLFSFVSFFSLLCVCVKKILSRLFFLSLLCLFLVSFLLSSVCQNSIRLSFCIKKSKAMRQLKNLSRLSSKILAATHHRLTTFIAFVVRRRLKVVVFL